jgi:hypothetical protein
MRARRAGGLLFDRDLWLNWGLGVDLDLVRGFDVSVWMRARRAGGSLVDGDLTLDLISDVDLDLGSRPTIKVVAGGVVRSEYNVKTACGRTV